MKTITADCTVCSTRFTYDYKGGRHRRTCHAPACGRVRNTQNQRRRRDRQVERPDGYRPADYPIGVEIGLPPKDELDITVELTSHLHERKRLRTQHDGVGQVGAFNSEDPDEPRGSRQILAAGHGYSMDDHREVDDRPLRFVPPDKRNAVREWFRSNGFPVAGFAGSTPKRGEPFWFVRGDLPDPARPVPPRLTRRWCSVSPLAASEQFIMIL